MYKLPSFTARDQEEILSFMEQHPFVTLIGYDGDFPVATQVPVKVASRDGDMILVGHVMTNTDHCKAFMARPHVLAVFSGAHAYISASVYEQPAVASTWNYKTVQVKGIMKFLSHKETYQVIKELTDQYEDTETSPASFHHLDESYIRKHLKAITGFEIKVSQVDHVFKMSQNHAATNRHRIISHLEQSSSDMDHLVAKGMREDLEDQQQ